MLKASLATILEVGHEAQSGESVNLLVPSLGPTCSPVFNLLLLSKRRHDIYRVCYEANKSSIEFYVFKSIELTVLVFI